MNKAITIFILALAFIGGFLIFYNPKPNPTTSDNSPQSSNAVQTWESKIDEQASVTVTVTPTDISIDAKEWKFNVLMDTHSVELDQDIAGASILIDNPGEEYKPSRWEGAGPGGHHREGTLVFAPIKPYPQHLSLIIKDIGGKDRLFAWIINGE